MTGPALSSHWPGVPDPGIRDRRRIKCLRSLGMIASEHVVLTGHGRQLALHASAQQHHGPARDAQRTAHHRTVRSSRSVASAAPVVDRVAGDGSRLSSSSMSMTVDVVCNLTQAGKTELVYPLGECDREWCGRHGKKFLDLVGFHPYIVGAGRDCNPGHTERRAACPSSPASPRLTAS